MHWVLQENIYNENGYSELIETLEKSQIPHSFHKVVPFIGQLEPDIFLDNPVICFGTYSMRHVAKEKGWKPGVFDLEEFDFRHQLHYWGNHMLNADSVCTKLKDVNCDRFDEDEYFFFRPLGDNKNFNGGVWSIKHMLSLYDGVRTLNTDEVYYGLTPNTLIIRSSLKEIYREIRCWVVKGKVVTASIYKEGSRIKYSSLVDQEAIDFAQDRVNEWQPVDAFVIDVALTPNGYKIVEINTINAAGFYEGNVQKLIFAMEDAFN